MHVWHIPVYKIFPKIKIQIFYLSLLAKGLAYAGHVNVISTDDIIISDRWRLRNAASLNDVDRLNELLKSGVDPNAADESGRTALHLACCRGYSDIVTSLLSHKADCNVVDKLGNTPLHLAVCTTSTATINLLLKAGSSVLAQENNGCTPLRLAQSKLWLLRRHMPKDCENLKQQVNNTVAS